jgi:hypothetical protein
MKHICNVILWAALGGYCLFSLINNFEDPLVDDQLVEITDEWKEDMSSIGLNGEDLLQRVDKIVVVDKIPYGLFNSKSTDDLMGRADYSTRSIYILSRKYERAQLKALVYHELGHYIFQLNHGDEGDVMSTYISEDPNYYEENWELILNKYLKRCKSNA